MPLYDVRCPIDGVREVFAGFNERPLRCDVCGQDAPQVFHPPYFSEDRCRLWRGPTGSRFSYALGAEMPESRQARDKLAKEKGVEFVGKREFLASNKEAAEAVEYTAHVNSGGRREDPKPAPPPAWKPKPQWAKDLGV